MEPLTHHSRRSFLRTAGLAGAAWLAPVGHLLARAAESPKGKGGPAHSVIVLWMQGGPSQLETFDPHPDTTIAAGTGAIPTAVKGIQLAPGLERVAEEMQSISLIRSMVSKEGDHERGTYNLKTGFAPDPTVIHPSLGAICCHELDAKGTDIPRHVSILPGQWPARGGFLGEKYDAFRMDDPAGPVPDTSSFLLKERDAKRLKGLDVIESAFAKGRQRQVETTLHRDTITAARKMMSSEQLQAFDVSRESDTVRKQYGDTPFGRGCLAARRLIEVGVRCVEVTLSGWDTHINNHEGVKTQLKTLDPAFAALVRDLRDRKLLDRTLVVWAGEFGRTPAVNPAGGRDHWPTGFSIALAGGGIRGGQVIGETDPDGKKLPTAPTKVADVHATILTALGIEAGKVNQTPIGRTVPYSSGEAIRDLLAKT